MPINYIKDIAAALAPPPEGGPTPEYRWRATVAFSIVAGYAIAGVQAALIWGFLGVAGFSGFASAATVVADRTDFQRQLLAAVEAQRQDTRNIMATVISGQILAMYATQCSAKRSGNVELAGNIADQLSGLQVKYMGFANGQQYPLQPCP